MFYHSDLLSIHGGRFSTIWLMGNASYDRIQMKTKGVPQREILRTKLRPIIKELLQLLPISSFHISLRMASVLGLGVSRVLRIKVKTLKKDVLNVNVTVSRRVRKLLAKESIEAPPMSAGKCTIPDPTEQDPGEDVEDVMKRIEADLIQEVDGSVRGLPDPEHPDEEVHSEVSHHLVDHDQFIMINDEFGKLNVSQEEENGDFFGLNGLTEAKDSLFRMQEDEGLFAQEATMMGDDNVLMPPPPEAPRKSHQDEHRGGPDETSSETSDQPQKKKKTLEVMMFDLDEAESSPKRRPEEEGDESESGPAPKKSRHDDEQPPDHPEMFPADEFVPEEVQEEVPEVQPVDIPEVQPVDVPEDVPGVMPKPVAVVGSPEAEILDLPGVNKEPKVKKVQKKKKNVRNLDLICQIPREEMRSRQLNDDYGQNSCLSGGMVQFLEVNLRAKFGKDNQVIIKGKKSVLKQVESRAGNNSNRLRDYFNKQLGSLANLEDQDEIPDIQEVEEVPEEPVIVPEGDQNESRRSSVLRDTSNLRGGNVNLTKGSDIYERSEVRNSVTNDQEPSIVHGGVEEAIVEDVAAEIEELNLLPPVLEPEMNTTPEPEIQPQPKEPEVQPQQEEPEVNITPIPEEEVAPKERSEGDDGGHGLLLNVDDVKERLLLQKDSSFEEIFNPETVSRRNAAIAFRHLLTLETSGWLCLSQKDYCSPLEINILGNA